MSKKSKTEKYQIETPNHQDLSPNSSEKVGPLYVDATSHEDALRRAHLKDGVYEVRCWETYHQDWDLPESYHLLEIKDGHIKELPTGEDALPKKRFLVSYTQRVPRSKRLEEIQQEMLAASEDHLRRIFATHFQSCSIKSIKPIP
jgi:hypothetical protein